MLFFVTKVSTSPVGLINSSSYTSLNSLETLFMSTAQWNGGGYLVDSVNVEYDCFALLVNKWELILKGVHVFTFSAYFDN